MATFRSRVGLVLDRLGVDPLHASITQVEVLVFAEDIHDGIGT